MLRNAFASVVRVSRSSLPYSARAFAASASLPELPYDYDALAPIISPEIMQLHHSKHHAAYVANYNIALEKYSAAEAAGDVQAMIALQPAIKFNGGGHVNHSIFWKNLAPVKDCTPPERELAAAIEAEFGSLDTMIGKFNVAAAGVQGSGWGWLGYNAATGKLQITTTANQDPCISTGLVPLLGIDVWEHAYYLQYKNVRPDYLKAVWQVVNWTDVHARLLEAKK